MAVTLRAVRAVAQHRDESPSRDGVAGVQDVVKVTHPQQRCNISRVRVFEKSGSVKKMTPP